MPVDQQVLAQCIAEAAGDDAEMATFLRDRYAKNDALAAKFVGGYMRSSDYTKKTQELSARTQELSAQRGEFEKQGRELAALHSALEAAEQEKSKILSDLAQHRMSTAKARELMKILQDKYQLTDEDLPGMSDLIETRKTGAPVDTTPNLDERFKKFGEDLIAQMDKRFAGAMMPELGAMAALPLIWNDINREHEELTGKRLSFSEQQDILKAARADNKPLRDVWEEKYSISGEDGLRQKKRDEKLRASWESEREKQEAERRSKQALEVVTPAQAELGAGPGISAAFRNGPLGGRDQYHPPEPQQFEAKPDTPTLSVQPGQHVRQTGARRPTGAQRAAAKYIERVQQGGYGRKTA